MTHHRKICNPAPLILIHSFRCGRNWQLVSTSKLLDNRPFPHKNTRNSSRGRFSGSRLNANMSTIHTSPTAKHPPETTDMKKSVGTLVSALWHVKRTQNLSSARN